MRTVGQLIEVLQACVDDPMWADHAEIRKATCSEVITHLQDHQSLKDSEAMLADISALLRSQTTYTGSYTEIVKQLLACAAVHRA